MGSLEAGKRMEEDYTKGIGIIRSEFERLRGSAEAFANVQASEMLSLQKEVAEIKEGIEDLVASRSVKKVEAELKSTNNFLWKLMSKVEEIQASLSAPRYSSTPFHTPTYPRQPAPHIRAPLDPDPISSLPPGIQIPGHPPHFKVDTDND